jgi:hypothetical protein
MNNQNKRKDIFPIVPDEVDYSEVVKAIEVTVNGYRIKGNYIVEIEGEEFLKTIRRKNQKAVIENEIVVRIKKGILVKEVYIVGFIRTIIVGEYK